MIIRELSHRLNDDSTVVLKTNNKALGALTSCVPAEELVTHLQFLRNLIASMVSDARYRKGGVGDGEFFLPGFNMPKGKSTTWRGDALDRQGSSTGNDDTSYEYS